MSDLARAVIFGRDAESYEQARPDYPPEAIAHLTSLVSATYAVEVGAGTGKATKDVARPGLELVCLEPSPQMAVVLEAKGLPGVEVIVSTFEDWEGSAASVDLIYAAQAWHWVDRSTAYARARALLRPGGSLALMWNVPADRYAEFEGIYTTFAPHLLAEQDERIRRRDSHDWLEDMQRSGFADLVRFTHHWSCEVSAPELRSLYSTYSDHMMLPEPERTHLLEGLERVVSERGGILTLHYRTEIFSGRA